MLDRTVTRHLRLRIRPGLEETRDKPLLCELYIPGMLHWAFQCSAYRLHLTLRGMQRWEWIGVIHDRVAEEARRAAAFGLGN